MGLVRELLWLDAIHPSSRQHMAEQVLKEPAVACGIWYTIFRRDGKASSFSAAKCSVLLSIAPQQYSGSGS